LLAKSDPEVRRAVEALLAQGGSGEAVLDRPAWHQASSLLDSVRTQFVPGERIGSYRVEGKLGAGGIGEVYRAKDIKLEREVAIKVLPLSVAQDPQRRIRFEREAKVLAHSQGLAFDQFHDKRTFLEAIFRELTREIVAFKIMLISSLVDRPESNRDLQGSIFELPAVYRF